MILSKPISLPSVGAGSARVNMVAEGFPVGPLWLAKAKMVDDIDFGVADGETGDAGLQDGHLDIWVVLHHEPGCCRLLGWLRLQPDGPVDLQD